MLDASGSQHLLLAETLGLAMARRASDILERHRAALTGGDAAGPDDDARFALDNAIFSAVLDAANECLGRFDARPADDRWCDALLQVINLARLAELLSPRGDDPPCPPMSGLARPVAQTAVVSAGRPRTRAAGNRCLVSPPPPSRRAGTSRPAGP
jgi:hypothetical protein